MRRCLGAAAMAAMSLLLLGTPNATALVHCAADGSEADSTVLALGHEGSPLPAPADGVVTGWKVPTGSSVRNPLEQRLLVFRRLGDASAFLAVAESDAKMVAGGTKVFRTRIPVKEGDLFGLRGTVETLVCDDVLGVTSGLHRGPTQVGFPYEFKAEAGLGVPLDVVIEADADGDGYGDETQDHCIRMSTTQDRCPAVNLRIKGAVVKTRSILLRVTTGIKAKALAIGEIHLRFTPPGSDSEVLEIAVMHGGVKRVLPRRSTRLKIGLLKVVLQQLDKMAPERSLKAAITVRALSVAGREEERKLTVRLPGRKDP